MTFTNRDHRDVIAAILESLYTNGGLGILDMIRATYTSWNQLLLILNELLEKEMISITVAAAIKLSNKRNHRVYFITEKGIHFLELYRKLQLCLVQAKTL